MEKQPEKKERKEGNKHEGRGREKRINRQRKRES